MELHAAGFRSMTVKRKRREKERAFAYTIEVEVNSFSHFSLTSFLGLLYRVLLC